MTLQTEQQPMPPNGGIVHANLANGTTALAFGTNSSVKVTPTATATLTSTIPAAGQVVYLNILTSGTTSYTLTFGTGFLGVPTLATGTVTAKNFVIMFYSNGTVLMQLVRTAAL
jgi:hypothetical protein